ncbi:ABC transporter permease [Nocardioides sambongensis]|uniref:ABC transporter permease n=1 Tax=Nocardioides sambongensis TaxID=2589074 RepID=UPI001128710E|nr:ABC transporter permease [Nocardioides sambongensis]
MAETTTVAEGGGAPAHRDLSEVPLAPPSANNGLLAVFQRRYLLRLLVRREINARYQGSFLGVLWSYINPLAQFFVYWAVIGGILNLHDDVENFAVHMFAGLVIVHFFTETFSAGTRSIVRNKSVVVKMPLPREMFPVATMLVSLWHTIPQIIVLVIACMLYGWTPDPVGMAAVLIAVVMIMTIGTSVALVFSVANVFFRDFGNVVQVLLLFVRFGVPMIYPYTMVEDRFGELARFYLLNPLADAVLLFQRAFWVGTTEDPEATAAHHIPDNILLIGCACAAVGVVMLVLAQLIFSKLENKIPERL